MGLRMEIGTGVGAGNVSRSGNGSGKLEQEQEQGRDEYALTGRVPDRASRPRQDECRTGRVMLGECRQLQEKTEESEVSEETEKTEEMWETARRFIDRKRYTR